MFTVDYGEDDDDDEDEEEVAMVCLAQAGSPNRPLMSPVLRLGPHKATQV